MNNGDLNRILNKLTAAATPLPDEGIPGDQSKIGEDPCVGLRIAPILKNSVRLIKKARSDLTIPNITIIQKQMILVEVYRNLIRYINEFKTLYCLCKKREQELAAALGTETIEINISSKLYDNFITDIEFSTKIGILAQSCLYEVLHKYLVRLSTGGFGIDEFCKHGGSLNSQPARELFARSIIAAGGIPEINVALGLPREILDVPTSCAEPKVEIIEDYLVEQGLAIGVAGILGATALGLYLRGNRAAAVTLIATATAAVGGTATGAESVMNAVDTDYNRSVRFGGQQDCRSENPTNTVGDGD